MDIFRELQDRGLVYQHTDEVALRKRLEEGPVTLYCGFDPTQIVYILEVCYPF